MTQEFVDAQFLTQLQNFLAGGRIELLQLFGGNAGDLIDDRHGIPGLCALYTQRLGDFLRKVAGALGHFLLGTVFRECLADCLFWIPCRSGAFADVDGLEILDMTRTATAAVVAAVAGGSGRGQSGWCRRSLTMLRRRGNDDGSPVFTGDDRGRCQNRFLVDVAVRHLLLLIGIGERRLSWWEVAFVRGDVTAVGAR